MYETQKKKMKVTKKLSFRLLLMHFCQFNLILSIDTPGIDLLNMYSYDLGKD